MTWVRLALVSLGLALGAFGHAADEGTWIDVDTGARTLTVYAGAGRMLSRFDNIAVGRGGVAVLHYHGDQSTPRGHYHIVKIRPSRRFDTFILLDYPRPEHAEMALKNGRIAPAARDAIASADADRQMPPQDTALGGEIGIHGIGRGNLRFHQLYNWTNGCIALTNDQIHQLIRLVQPGMAVVIH